MTRREKAEAKRSRRLAKALADAWALEVREAEAKLVSNRSVRDAGAL